MIKEEILNVELRKEDCIALLDAQKKLGLSRTSLYNYLNALHVTKHQFPFDRKLYLTKQDFKRVKAFSESREG